MLFSLAAHSLAVRQLWITGDGIVATASDDKEIRLWDCRMPWSTDMGTLIATCKGHKASVTNVRMTREGTGVISASEDATMILWDVLNASPVRIFVGHTAPITQVPVLRSSPADLCAYCISLGFMCVTFDSIKKKTIPLKNMQHDNRKARCILRQKNPPQVLLLEPAENEIIDPSKRKSRIFGYTKYVISSSDDGTIRVWNIFSGIDECFTV